MEEFDDIFDENDIVDEDDTIVDESNDDLKSIFSEDDIVVKETNPLIDDLLKSKGIVDNKITIIEEDNTSKEVDFYSLTKEEQLEILSYIDPVEDNSATDIPEELSTLAQHLKDNKITLQEYLDKYKEDILSEVTQTQIYEIDAYDDEELYLLDLKSKFDLTDEEAAKELNRALEDKELFDKKVVKLRADYKQLEDKYKEDQKLQFEAKREDQYNQFVTTMVESAQKNPELYGILLDENEQNTVLSSLLELDDKGVSNFYKSLQEPDNLYKAAWFMTYGEQAFNEIISAYEAEIAKLKKSDSKPVVRSKNVETTKIPSIHELI